MKLINYPLFVLAVGVFTSCSKELSLEQADPDIAKATALQNLVVNKKFQLKAFYSDVPIDYVQDDDTVKQETNLWPYVSNYLKDDFDSFAVNGTDVTIEQNTLQMPGENAPVLHRSYAIATDNYGAHMTFLDYEYHPLKYDLYKVGPDYFILSIRWQDKARLYSRFEVVP